jgi:hypothetical protein
MFQIKNDLSPLYWDNSSELPSGTSNMVLETICAINFNEKPLKTKIKRDPLTKNFSFVDK